MFVGLKVKYLEPGALAPTVAHPGEDLGYDLYALDTVCLIPGKITKLRTGIAVEAIDPYGKPLGLLIRDRSSMAAKGIFTHGGVIDAGYRGEIVVLMTAMGHEIYGAKTINAGERIAQMIPVPILTGSVNVFDELSRADRGDSGFGSSGR